mmetsp:Transcript_12523/g.29666  ORF Transcript_12523/g.29666 Transcript_12523/m.29666 type:complete len:189 (-) Transcript_12523:290-856(-)
MEFVSSTAAAELRQQQHKQQPPTQPISRNDLGGGGETKKSRNVRGPVFVSIGSADQLEMFLERNPAVPRDSILVDDYDHGSYRDTMGFNRFDEITSINQLRGLDPSKLVFPLFRTLGAAKLADYVRRVPFLAPVEGDLDWRDLPEGGLRNGGTIVVGGGSILYRWNDAIPGDVPEPRDVYREATAAAS